ncbi:hypothetical protein IFM89_019531 [Coptis chinensis]|uniref:Uncharacterized protein n=1 Tax=Coptis chinensis TaxID=261450 RepID=A0A835I1J5_9MAGN|nr:hypothetical protein IFM89_019531 [Coptis chinensis]
MEVVIASADVPEVAIGNAHAYESDSDTEMCQSNMFAALVPYVEERQSDNMQTNSNPLMHYDLEQNEYNNLQEATRNGDLEDEEPSEDETIYFKDKNNIPLAELQPPMKFVRNRPDDDICFRKRHGVPSNASVIMGVAGCLVRDKEHPLLYQAFSSIIRLELPWCVLTSSLYRGIAESSKRRPAVLHRKGMACKEYALSMFMQQRWLRLMKDSFCV